jgi:apolipoprotein N-acyltransferase
MRWWIAALMALIARAIGGTNMWTYHERLQFPLFLNVETLLIPAAIFALAVLLFRAFVRQGRPWLAILAFPTCMVAAEYGLSLSFGTFGATAYTQLNNIPVLQIAATTGLWGVSFIVLLFAPMVAVITTTSAAQRQSVIAFVLIFGAVFGYGAWRMESTPTAPASVRVGLIASMTPQNIYNSGGQDAMRLLREYAAQVPALAAQGAKIVVLPEMTAVVDDTISPEVDTLFQQTAHASRVQIMVGVLRVGTTTFNEARLYSDSTATTTLYHKHHLVPVLEGRATPGDGISILSQQEGKIGLAVCRDMDYPDPSRLYGQQGVGLLLVPAWDQTEDRWWHGHMALMRGIENGYSIVRSAKAGYLTVSDDRGRVLAEATNIPSETFTTLLATVPVRHDSTLYQSWGDWFAWLDLAGLVGLLISCLNGIHSRSPRGDEYRGVVR